MTVEWESNFDKEDMAPEKMRAKLILEGRWKLSKQNSYLAGAHGRKYKNPAYATEQVRMLMAIHPQLTAQGWHVTKEPVALRIEFHGPTQPVDFDNCGLLTDALQGPLITIAGKRIRRAGPVVVDDRQFNPVTVEWIKGKERRIIVELEAQ